MKSTSQSLNSDMKQYCSLPGLPSSFVWKSSFKFTSVGWTWNPKIEMVCMCVTVSSWNNIFFLQLIFYQKKKKKKTAQNKVCLKLHQIIYVEKSTPINSYILKKGNQKFNMISQRISPQGSHSLRKKNN